MIRGPLPSCAGETQPPQNPSTHVETAGEREDKAEKEEDEQEKKGREVCLDLIHRRKRVGSLVGKSPASVTSPPPPHTHTHTLGTGQVWLCGGLVGLADGFTSVHHCWLTCAFTGRYCRLGYCLSNIMQRWLSVHGNF